MKPVQGLLPMLLPVCVAALIFGCGGGSEPADTATQGGPVATTTGTATPLPASDPTTSPTVPLSATPGPAPAGFYEPGKRTGIPEVDAIITDMLARDVTALQSLVQFSEAACAAHPMGVGSPPKCADGESDGQLVEVLPRAAGEREWVRPPAVAERMQLIVSRPTFLYAVYIATDADWPGAKYGIRFGVSLSDIGSPGFIINAEGKIVKLLGPAGQVELQIPPGSTFVLPPLGAPQ